MFRLAILITCRAILDCAGGHAAAGNHSQRTATAVSGLIFFLLSGSRRATYPILTLRVGAIELPMLAQ